MAGNVMIGTRGPNIIMVPKGEGEPPMEVCFENGVAQVPQEVADIILSPRFNADKNYFIPGEEQNVLDMNNPIQIMEYGLQSLLSQNKFGEARTWVINANNKVETAMMNLQDPGAQQLGPGQQPEGGQMAKPEVLKEMFGDAPTMVRTPDGREMSITELNPDGNVVEKIEEDEVEEEVVEEPVIMDEDAESIKKTAEDLAEMGESISRSEKKKKKHKKSKKNKKTKIRAIDESDDE